MCGGFYLPLPPPPPPSPSFQQLVDSGEIKGGNWYYCLIYVAFSSGFVLLNLVSLLSFVLLTSRASRGLHKLCLQAVMGAPLGWFESVPSGRILSRFAADLLVMVRVCLGGSGRLQ